MSTSTSTNTCEIPEGFLLGAATSAYQIEGGSSTDLRGESVWDAFCCIDGAISDGSSARVAADHWTRAADDLSLLCELGLGAYRFSVSWPRVLPGGVGSVNERGVAFYADIVEKLRNAGITPLVTLFHWDLPLDLSMRGGWLNPDSPRWFADYAELVVRRLGRGVGYWITFNEPRVFVDLGYKQGIHAPGLSLSDDQIHVIVANVIRAHRLAVQVIRTYGEPDAKVGVAFGSEIAVPATDDTIDVQAARSWTFSDEDLSRDGFWLEPLVGGRLPAALQSFCSDCRFPPHAKLDFIGMNAYTGTTVSAAPGGEPREVPFPDGAPRNSLGWPVLPSVLYWGTTFYHERYDLPVLVTENGMAIMDWVDERGAVDDVQRVHYLHAHLRELLRASDAGVPVLGYCAWSLIDNFEWAAGFTQRFGLVYVDFQTGKRTVKLSGRWFSALCRSRRLVALEALSLPPFRD